jgi:hypothetical protein
MKIQNILRMQAVVIGFAGVLFLASSAPAQEITNTEWADAPGATVSARAAMPAASEAGTVATNSNSVNASASVATPMAKQEAAVSQWPAVETWALACGIVFFTLVALYRRVAARHADENLEARVRQVNDRLAVS